MICSECGSSVELLQEEPPIFYCEKCKITYKGEFEVNASLNGHTE